MVILNCCDANHGSKKIVNFKIRFTFTFYQEETVPQFRIPLNDTTGRLQKTYLLAFQPVRYCHWNTRTIPKYETISSRQEAQSGINATRYKVQTVIVLKDICRHYNELSG